MECENCKNGEHNYCLFDPPYNTCDCCVGKGYKPTAIEAMQDEAQQIVGSDGGLEFVH